MALQGGPKLRQRHAGQVGEEGERDIEVLGLLPGKGDVERVAVLDQHAPVAVQHGAARSGQNQGALVIVLGELPVLVVLDDLKPPEADGEGHEDQHDAPPPHRQQQGEAVARPLPRTRFETAEHAHRIGLNPGPRPARRLTAPRRPAPSRRRPAPTRRGSRRRPAARPYSAWRPPGHRPRRRCRSASSGIVRSPAATKIPTTVLAAACTSRSRWATTMRSSNNSR